MLFQYSIDAVPFGCQNFKVFLSYDLKSLCLKFAVGNFLLLHMNTLTQSFLETCNRVIGKQCRPIADAA